MKRLQLNDQHIAKLYENGATTPEIARYLNVSNQTVGRRLKALGVARRPTGHRKFKTYEGYFHEIDIPDKAYWLGFLTADGHVSKRYVELSLAECDREHVQKFCNELNYKGKIGTKVDHGFPQARVSIGSVLMANRLRELGFESNKTWTIQPLGLHPTLMSHYWRGVVDGDGSLSKREDGRWVLTLVGNEAIVTAFRDWAYSKIGHNAMVCDASETGLKAVYFEKEHGFKLASVLYDGRTFLSRKMDKFKQMKEDYNGDC